MALVYLWIYIATCSLSSSIPCASFDYPALFSSSDLEWQCGKVRSFPLRTENVAHMNCLEGQSAEQGQVPMAGITLHRRQAPARVGNRKEGKRKKRKGRMDAGSHRPKTRKTSTKFQQSTAPDTGTQIDSHLTEPQEARKRREYEKVASPSSPGRPCSRAQTQLPQQHADLPWHDFREEALKCVPHPMQMAPHKIEAWIDTRVAQSKKAREHIDQLKRTPRETIARQMHRIQLAQLRSQHGQIERTIGELESIRAGLPTVPTIGAKPRASHRLPLGTEKERIRASLQDYLSVAKQYDSHDEVRSFLNWHRAWQRHAELRALSVARTPSPPPRIDEVAEYFANARTNGGPGFQLHSTKRHLPPANRAQQQTLPPEALSPTTSSESYPDRAHVTPGSHGQQALLDRTSAQQQPAPTIDMDKLYRDVLPHLQRLSEKRSPPADGR